MRHLKRKALKKLIVTLAVILITTGCSTIYPNQDIVNQSFPDAEGQSLAGDTLQLPEAFKGQYHVLLLGYVQNAQFDIDRWLIGLDMKQVQLPVYEIPTIQGWIPRMISSTIDNGMRKGIPSALWQAVVTVYKDGDKVQLFTGNENPRNGRAILLSPDSEVLFFHDQGFSVPALNALITTQQEHQKNAQ